MSKLPNSIKIFAAVLVLLLLAGLVFFVLTLKSKPEPTPVPTPGPGPDVTVVPKNDQVPEGPIHGIWGEVVKIEDDPGDINFPVAIRVPPNEVGASRVHVSVVWDPDKIYEFQVNHNVLITKNFYGDTVIGIQEGDISQEDLLSWEDIEVGDKVFIDTRVNLAKETVIPVSFINYFNIYR